MGSRRVLAICLLLLLLGSVIGCAQSSGPSPKADPGAVMSEAISGTWYAGSGQSLQVKGSDIVVVVSGAVKQTMASNFTFDGYDVVDGRGGTASRYRVVYYDGKHLVLDQLGISTSGTIGGTGTPSGLWIVVARDEAWIEDARARVTLQSSGNSPGEQLYDALLKGGLLDASANLVR